MMMGRVRPAVLGSDALIKASVFSYVGILVILPLLALSAQALGQGFGKILSDVMQPQAWFSLKLTFSCAIAMALLNLITGTAMAWVLVRYNFPGKPLINSLIDLPFALPTTVTGLMLVVLYGPVSWLGKYLKIHGIEIIYAQPGISLARLFVTVCDNFLIGPDGKIENIHKTERKIFEL